MPKDTYMGTPVFMLEERWQDQLSKLPESGMDYQIVDIHLKDGRIFKNIVVAGCRCFIVDAGFSLDDDDIVLIKMTARP